jgi:LCP family protein required for cell wall assembly
VATPENRTAPEFRRFASTIHPAVSAPASLGSFLRRFAVALVIVAVVAASGVVFGNAFGSHEFAKSKTLRIPCDVLTCNTEKGKPANVLLIGSDARDPNETPEQARAFGTQAQTGPPHSDTMMVLHVDPSAGTGLVVSIPRDLLVTIPGHGRDKINAAFAFGGPKLLIQTIQQDLRIPIMHYLEVNFIEFQKIVDAIGSVNVYFPTPMHDPYTGLDVNQAGCRSLNGAEALAYARSRHYYVPRNRKNPTPWQWNSYVEKHGVPGWYADGSDVQRIPRQQYFVRTLSEAALKKVGNNPLKIVALLDAVMTNMTRDTGLSEAQIKALVRTFRGLNPATVQMQTLPNEPAGDGANVVVKRPEANAIIDRLQNFSIPKSLPSLVAPRTVKVRVVNGSGVKGKARKVLDSFVAHGYVAAGPPADADRSDYAQTQVRYAPGQAAKGVTVGSALQAPVIVEAASSAETLGGDVLVIVGRDYDDLPGVLLQPAAPTTASTRPGSSQTTASSTTTSTTLPQVTVDTRFVPVDPKTGGPLVGCP